MSYINLQFDFVFDTCCTVVLALCLKSAQHYKLNDDNDDDDDLRVNSGRTVNGWTTLADLLVFRSVRSALGFDRCRMCLTAAAPIMKDTLDFFMSLNLPLMEIYGMSETAGLLYICLLYNTNQRAV